MIPISNFLTNLRGKNDWYKFAQGSGKCDYQTIDNCVTVCEINLEKLEMQGRRDLNVPVQFKSCTYANRISSKGSCWNEELQNEFLHGSYLFKPYWRKIWFGFLLMYGSIMALKLSSLQWEVWLTHFDNFLGHWERQPMATLSLLESMWQIYFANRMSWNFWHLWCHFEALIFSRHCHFPSWLSSTSTIWTKERGR